MAQPTVISKGNRNKTLETSGFLICHSAIAISPHTLSPALFCALPHRNAAGCPIIPADAGFPPFFNEIIF